MTAWSAFIEGCNRVKRAPTLVAGLWLATLLVAWPLALVLREMLAAHLGPSMAAEAAVTGVNFDWWNEFLSQASGIGQTFVPAIIGFAAVVDNLSSIADARRVPVRAKTARAARQGRQRDRRAVRLARLDRTRPRD